MLQTDKSVLLESAMAMAKTRKFTEFVVWLNSHGLPKLSINNLRHWKQCDDHAIVTWFEEFSKRRLNSEISKRQKECEELRHENEDLKSQVRTLHRSLEQVTSLQQ